MILLLLCAAGWAGQIELTDENFEEATHVTTGGDTGDWFILFYDDDSSDSARWVGEWDELA